MNDADELGGAAGAATPYEHEIFGTPEDFAQTVLEWGTLGWADDDQVYDDLSSDDGVVLVKVTLFKGYPVGQPKASDGGANGHQILCSLTGPIVSIPQTKGALCLIAFGGGLVDAFGGGMIIGIRDLKQVGKAGNAVPGDQVIATPGAAPRVVLKGAKGAVTLETTDDNTDTGKAVYLRVAPDALEFHSPFGTLIFNATGFHVITQSLGSLSLGGVSDPSAPSYFQVVVSNTLIDCPRNFIGATVGNGGAGLFLAPVVAPSASPEPGTPVPIGVGMGVVAGVTATQVFVGSGT